MLRSILLKQYIESLYPCQVGFVRARIFTELITYLEKYQEINHDLQLLEDNIDVRIDPFKIYKDAKTIIVILLPYLNTSEIENKSHVVSKSSYGIDYHLVIKEKLKVVQDYLAESFGKESIVLCDNHPLHDRFIAHLAGLGNFGKNTLLINKSYGSYFFIGLILTNLELSDCEFNSPDFLDVCKDCNRCIKACPTGAISEGRFINAKRCMSYLTQSKEPIQEDYLSKFTKYSFGCDICQVACVYNSNVKVAVLDEFNPTNREIIKVKSLEKLSNKQFNEKYRTLGASFRGKNVLLRNAILVSANNNDLQDLESLEEITDCGNAYLRQAINYAKKKIDKEGK